MLKLAKYLKPYLMITIFCVACVVVQAVANLKLPDLMSEIVDIGVQKYGIEDAVPEKLRNETYQGLLLLMSEAERDIVVSYYEVQSDADAVISLDKTPSKEDREVLNTAFGRGFATLGLIQQGAIGGQMGDNPLETLQQMSPEEHSALLQQIDHALNEMGAMITDNMVAMVMKTEYEAAGIDIDAYQQAAILRIGGKMLLVSLLIVVTTIIPAYLSAKAASGFGRDIRGAVFSKVVSFSSAEINKFSTASLITRTTNDIQQVQQVVTMMMRLVIFAPVMGIGGVVNAMRKSPSMSWILALAVIVLLGIIGVLFTAVMPKFKKLQKLVDRLNQVARENVSGIMVSRAYNTQEFEKERFETANKNLASTNLFVNRAMVMLMPMMNLIMNGVMLMILWFGAKEIEASTLQIGDMMAYMQYAMHVVISFIFVSAMFIMIPRAAVSGDRIAEVLACENSISDPPQPVAMGSGLALRGLVEFDNVSFKYPGAEGNTLDNVSFTAKPGEVTAFIGSTGSGKTTIANLLMRFFDVDKGAIKVGGIDIRDVTQHDLRSQIGYVPQKSTLFTGTIEDNIRFGAKDASIEEIEQAAETAQAMAFIREKDNGLQEVIAQGGTNVSGGQRQRLSIARALAVRAPIYLFDDSFSALDFKTDAALRRALAQKASDATILLVAQRVGTIMNAAQIVVLDEGKVVGKGTHAQLMESCEIYQSIARSQLREEELA